MAMYCTATALDSQVIPDTTNVILFSQGSFLFVNHKRWWKETRSNVVVDICVSCVHVHACVCGETKQYRGSMQENIIVVHHNHDDVIMHS